MAITINSNPVINNLNLEEYIITLDATTDAPPLEYSIDNQAYQLVPQFIVPNDEKKKYTIYYRDGSGDFEFQWVFADECGIEVNKDNFLRWKGVQGLWIDNGQIIPAECPGIVLGNDTPLEVIGHCIVLD